MKKVLPPEQALEDEAGVKDLIILLSKEINAINNGDLDRVVDLYKQKTNLLERLEAATPKINAQLKEETERREELRSNLMELHALIRKDAQLLANMTEATREIIAEIARIRGRHSLDGLYSSTGEKQPEVVPFAQQIDQSV